jgi:hypothetical protein
MSPRAAEEGRRVRAVCVSVERRSPDLLTSLFNGFLETIVMSPLY